MCSVLNPMSRRLTALALTGASLATVGALTGGCAKRQPERVEVNTTPLVIDEAMQRRDWDRSIAYYPNGAVIAGPTLFNYEPKRNQVGYSYFASDSLTFFVNIVLLPLYYIRTPPSLTALTYH